MLWQKFDLLTSGKETTMPGMFCPPYAIWKKKRWKLYIYEENVSDDEEYTSKLRTDKKAADLSVGRAICDWQIYQI